MRNQWIPQLPQASGVHFGACYYPEHWPEERWQTDADMMRECGFTVVRLAELAWSVLEPEQGRFDFAWLDRVIAILAERGIKAIVGTPTAAPPKWLMDKHPDIYKINRLGQSLGFGTRMYCCFNNPVFPEYARSIVERMAAHYGGNPNVIGWQIDNEFGCVDTTWCYCDNCLHAFQDWLRGKYATLEQLNDSWGTVTFSHSYRTWEQIPLPGLSVHQLHNPGLQLDYRRFASEAVKRFMDIQVDILRSHTSEQRITTNFMGVFPDIDAYRLSGSLDFASWDNYPNHTQEREISVSLPALQHDITRGLKQANFWVMEHQSGTPGADVLQRTPKPGELRRWTYQSIAHGADGIVYFRWRTALFGCEQYWHGILQHSGKRGRRFREVEQVGRELAKIGSRLIRSENRARVAIIRCFDNEWAFTIQPHSPGYSYMKHLHNYYDCFFERNIPIDIVSPDANWGRYDLVVMPNMIMTDDEFVARTEQYVLAGGQVVLDFRAGAKDRRNRMEPLALPGKFGELLGIEIEDYGIIREDGSEIGIAWADGKENKLLGNARVWYDVIELKGAEAVASYTSDYFAGSPAITRMSRGKGKAWYIGTEPDEGALRLLFDRIADGCGINPHLNVTAEGVEVVCRTDDSLTSYYFVINHRSEQAELNLESPMLDLLTDRIFSGTSKLDGNDVWVLVPHTPEHAGGEF